MNVGIHKFRKYLEGGKENKKKKKRGKKRKEQKIDQIRKVKNWKMKEKRKEKSVNVQCAINDPTLTKYCVGKKH